MSACPSSDLSILGFQQSVTNVQSLLQTSTDNCAILDQPVDTCLNDYGYFFAGDKAFNPLNLPTGVPGNDPLTNLPGNAFTEFGASTFALTLFPGYTSVITPAPFNNQAAAATGLQAGSFSPTGSAFSGNSGTGTAAGTGSTPTSTQKSGAGTLTAGAWIWGLLLLTCFA